MPSHIDVSSGHALNVSIENSSGSDLSKNFTSLHSAALIRVASLSIIGFNSGGDGVNSGGDGFAVAFVATTTADSRFFRTLLVPLLEEHSAMVVEIVLAILRFDILLKCKQIILILLRNFSPPPSLRRQI